MQLLSTRMLDEKLVARAAANHLKIDSIAFIKTTPLQSISLAEQLQTLGRQSLTVVFTSSNAVSAVAAQITLVPDWKIFCTGGSTKENAIKYFGAATVAGSAKNATLLAEKIAGAKDVHDLVFFCGDQRLNDLPETLIRYGKRVSEVIVYATAQTPVFMEKDYAGILFFSPSAAHSFFSVNTISTEAVLFSIGQTTTQVIQSYCTNKVITSEWPGAESMIELAVKYYQKAGYAF